MTATDNGQDFGGLYRGKIVDVSDPAKQNRVRVIVPQLFSTDVTAWCPVLRPIGTSVPTPTYNTLVWVMFEGGDPDFPVVVGLV